MKINIGSLLNQKLNEIEARDDTQTFINYSHT